MLRWISFKARSNVILPVILALAGVSFWSATALAFPELAREGYVNCTACHASPTGGGVLNPYGRELSRELLSWKGGEREQAVLHGLLPEGALSDSVMIGGDVRGVQTYRDTLYFRQGQFIFMQAEVETALKLGRFTVDGALGRLTDGVDAWFGTHRYWASYSFTDETSVRAGLFYPAFGLNIPEHFMNVRRGMGFDEGMETRNLELSWLGDAWSAYLTGSLASSDPVAQAQGRASSVEAQLNRHFSDSVKIGGSFLWGSPADPSGAATQALAVHGTVGLSRTLFLMAEADGKWSGPDFALNRYAKFGYEPVQGWVFSLFNDATSGSEGIGPSIQLFPRPHFQFDLAAEKVFSGRSMPAGDTFGWLLLHYYL